MYVDMYRYMFVFQLEALKKYANKGVRFVDGDGYFRWEWGGGGGWAMVMGLGMGRGEVKQFTK